MEPNVDRIVLLQRKLHHVDVIAGVQVVLLCSVCVRGVSQRPCRLPGVVFLVGVWVVADQPTGRHQQPDAVVGLVRLFDLVGRIDASLHHLGLVTHLQDPGQGAAARRARHAAVERRDLTGKDALIVDFNVHCRGRRRVVSLVKYLHPQRDHLAGDGRGGVERWVLEAKIVLRRRWLADNELDGCAIVRLRLFGFAEFLVRIDAGFELISALFEARHLDVAAPGAVTWIRRRQHAARDLLAADGQGDRSGR